MGHHVHELCLGFRFPSLILKPLSEGRYDYIAFVPLDFRPQYATRGNLQPNFPGTLRHLEPARETRTLQRELLRQT
jgi:hypothetical protein